MEYKIKSKRKSKGFTIPEAIVCFTIMGLMFIATITNIGRNDHYDKLYWQAFDTLFQAAKSAQAEYENSHKQEKEKWNATKHGEWIDSSTERYTTNLEREYPSFLMANNGDVDEFCTRLTAFINLRQGSKQCKSKLHSNYNITEPRGKVGVSFIKGYSSLKDESSDGTVDLNPLTPSFVAANGQKFYISEVMTANSFNKNVEFANNKRENFRFVVVDINGDAGPNTQFIQGGRNPDTVLFAIDKDGNVIPLGLPEWSKTYISARVTYPNDVNADGSPLYPKKHSSVDTLWNTKKRAWGDPTNQATKEGEGGTLTGANWAQPVSQFVPLSQSTKFYENANECIKNPTSCKNDVKGARYVDIEYTYLVMQFLYKQESSSEQYDILTNDPYNAQLDSENGCTTITNKSDDAACGIDFKH